MRLVIGLLVFWLATWGWSLFLQKKLKTNRFFTLALTFTGFGMIMFVAGILNIMRLTAIALVLGGILYLTYRVIRANDRLEYVKKYLKDPTSWVTILIFGWITILGWNMHLVNYDNFSHWGLIAENVFIDNRLPNFENPVVTFIGYQPGSVSFIYLVGQLIGKTEGAMIIAQNYLVFAYIGTLFGLIKNNRRKPLKIILVTLFYFFVLMTTISIGNLQVDGLLAAMLIATFTMMYYYRKNLRMVAIVAIPMMLYMLLVKNTGLVLSGFVLVYLLYLAYRQKKLKTGLKYALTGVAALLFVWIIWQHHVTLVYGDTALDSRHTMSAARIGSALEDLGWGHLVEFIQLYIHNFFSLGFSTIYMLIINMVILLMVIFAKKRKSLLTLLLAVNLLYVAYYLILGVMYILSMPYAEAMILASYERYIATILATVAGIIVIYLLNKDSNVRYPRLALCSLSALMLIPIGVPIYQEDVNFKGNITALTGQNCYAGSKVEHWDQLLPKIPIDKNLHYYIVNTSANGAGEDFMQFLSAYKLNSANVTVIMDSNDIEEKDLTNLEDSSVVVVFDDDIKTKQLLDDMGLTSEDGVVYRPNP